MLIWWWLWNNLLKSTCSANITLGASTCWSSSQARVTSAEALSPLKFPKAQLCRSFWPNILSETYEEPPQNTTFHFTVYSIQMICNWEDTSLLFNFEILSLIKNTSFPLHNAHINTVGFPKSTKIEHFKRFPKNCDCSGPQVAPKWSTCDLSVSYLLSSKHLLYEHRSAN